MTSNLDTAVTDEVRRVRHKKRGTEYTIIGEGRTQCNWALADMAHVTIYRGDDGEYWVRPTIEFEDGRFEELPPLASQAVETKAVGPSTGAGMVRGLEWHKHERDDIERHSADPPFASYIITWTASGYELFIGFWGSGAEPKPPYFPTIEAAKAAAQADYERRIMSALEPVAVEAEPTGRVRVPKGQTPLNDDLHHPLLDAFNAGSKSRDSGERSPYHGHSLEHLLHACGWVQRDLRLALDASKAPASLAVDQTMREALKPFADYASLASFDRLPDDMSLTQGSRIAAKQVTVGDFKRARDAYRATFKQEGPK